MPLGRLPLPLPGMTTGVGSKAVKTAVASGVAGGDLSTRFRDAMRGKTPVSDVVEEARAAVGNLYTTRGQQYKSDMAAVSGDPAILDFADVDKALADVSGVKNYKGIPISKSTEGVRTRIAEIADEWRELDPTEFHTVEGFDALKQSFGDVLDSVPYGGAEWKVANTAYQGVRKSIVKQAPEYAKAMSNYEQASTLLKEVQGELSLGKSSNAATSLRKLQSIIRDDVSSAYGRRAELGAVLEDAGARGLKREHCRTQYVECLASRPARRSDGRRHDNRDWCRRWIKSRNSGGDGGNGGGEFSPRCRRGGPCGWESRRTRLACRSEGASGPARSSACDLSNWPHERPEPRRAQAPDGPRQIITRRRSTAAQWATVNA